MIETSLIILVALAAVIILILSFSRLVRFESSIESFKKEQERTERSLKDEIARNREEGNVSAKSMREEMLNAMKTFNDSLIANMADIATLQKNQLETFSNQLSRLTKGNEERLERMRSSVEERLRLLQDENSKRLDQMRAIVDEKLHATLEKRLGESFKQVSERLEEVHRGLGEMQTLAAGVGDLKRVLANVKTRGTWGEIQLGILLEEILTPDQFAKNVATKKGSNERVEYAVRLPGRDGRDGTEIWLPIDAKFPQEAYQRLLDAQETGNPALIDEAVKHLEGRIKSEAKTVKEKYIDPPNTTDFGIIFLPIEGLYAEVLRRPGLPNILQRDFRVIVTGPTTLAALLNSLQMGFRTLAIEKRSSEVWRLLGAVKTDFGRFGDILEKTHKKLKEASNTIEGAARRSRSIERRLRDVQSLPAKETGRILKDVGEAERLPLKEEE